MGEKKNKKKKTYTVEGLSNYAKLVNDGLLEAAGDDRAVQGLTMDHKVKLQSMTTLKMSNEDNKGNLEERASITIKGDITITTEEK